MTDTDKVKTTELPDGKLHTYEATGDDVSRMYVLDVLGVSLLIYLRDDGTPYVHVDREDDPGPLLVEVNNGGEEEYL